MWRLLTLVLLPVALATTVFAAGPDEAAVKSVVEQFQWAMERHDVGAIEALVSSDLVVLENGHRNDGWKDFRDNHLVPEFKEPAEPTTWEFVKVVAGSEMAWGYTKQTLDATGKNGKHVGYLVWSAYVLQKTRPVWNLAFLDLRLTSLWHRGLVHRLGYVTTFNSRVNPLFRIRVRRNRECLMANKRGMVKRTDAREASKIHAHSAG